MTFTIKIPYHMWAVILKIIKSKRIEMEALGITNTPRYTTLLDIEKVIGDAKCQEQEE